MDWPGCSKCKHLKPLEPGKTWSCTAFPNGIPMPIASGMVDHLHPVEGDGGIQFEAREP